MQPKIYRSSDVGTHAHTSKSLKINTMHGYRNIQTQVALKGLFACNYFIVIYYCVATGKLSSMKLLTKIFSWMTTCMHPASC